MDNRSLGFGLAGFAGLSAVLTALSAGLSGSTQQLPQRAIAPARTERGELIRLTLRSKDSVRTTYHHGARLLEEYNRRSAGCAAPTTAPCGVVGDASRDSLKIVIASIPDPFDSHMDWAYDAYLESFRRAFATVGYVPDRYWLPARSDSMNVVAGADSHRVSLHEVFPGVLLFRNQQQVPHKLALLYLVSELPTSGMHKDAFLAAVRERRLLLDDHASFAVSDAVRDTLLIAGPIFSGASQSLRRALSDALEFVDPALRGVRIVTGSATNAQNQATLSRPIRAVPMSFQATLNSDDAMRDVLDSTLHTLGIPGDRVAILSEASTQYGQQRADTPSEYLTISFPLNIGSLRNEVDEANGTAATPSIPGLTETARTRLVLRERARARETPSVESELTVPTLELMLSEIVQILADREIRAVVIQATDIRDQLMLAREIRRRNRNTQIFIFQGHRLLLRPEFAAQLNGTLVLTTYPLFLGNQWWTQSTTSARVSELKSLSNDAAIGTYNGVLTLLNVRDGRVEYESPYAKAGSMHIPPIWLTAVANRTFVPISVTETPSKFRGYFGNDTLTKNAVTSPTSLAIGNHTVIAMAIVVLGLSLLIACTVVLLKRLPFRGADRAPFSERDVPYVRIEAFSLLLHERIYATLLIVALTGIFVPTAVTFVWSGGSTLARALVILTSVVAIGVVVTGFLDIMRMLWRFAPEGYRYAMYNARWRTIDSSRRGPRQTSRVAKFLSDLYQRGHLEQLRWWGEIVGRATIALVGMLHLILTLVYTAQLLHIANADQPRFFVFAYRALRGMSGASPLVPLILCGCGFALWSAWHWRLTHHLRTEQTATELASLAHARVKRRRPLADPFSRASVCVESARAALFRIHPTGIGFALTAALLVLAVLVFTQHSGSLEQLVLVNTPLRSSYDLLFWIGAMSMLVTGAWAIYRVTATWSALQGALIAVSETPLVNAFARLPRHVAKLTRLSIFTVSESEAVQHTSSERWREMQRHLRELATEMKRDAHRGMDPSISSAFTNADREIAASLYARLNQCGTTDDFSSLKASRRAQLLRKTARAMGAVWRRADTSPAANGAVPTETLRLAPQIFAVVRTAEEFIAIECVRYVESILHNLRLLASFLLVTLLLSVALLSAYPFQPQGIVKLAFVALLLGTVVALFLVLTQMSRDDVLSVITRTEPGKVSWDTTLVLNLALFGVIPLLALVSSEFPGVRAFLFSWAEPMVRSLVKV